MKEIILLGSGLLSFFTGGPVGSLYALPSQYRILFPEPPVFGVLQITELYHVTAGKDTFEGIQFNSSVLSMKERRYRDIKEQIHGSGANEKQSTGRCVLCYIPHVTRLLIFKRDYMSTRIPPLFPLAS